MFGRKGQDSAKHQQAPAQDEPDQVKIARDNLRAKRHQDRVDKIIVYWTTVIFLAGITGGIAYGVTWRGKVTTAADLKSSALWVIVPTVLVFLALTSCRAQFVKQRAKVRKDPNVERWMPWAFLSVTLLFGLGGAYMFYFRISRATIAQQHAEFGIMIILLIVAKLILRWDVKRLYFAVDEPQEAASGSDSGRNGPTSPPPRLEREFEPNLERYVSNGAATH